MVAMPIFYETVYDLDRQQICETANTKLFFAHHSHIKPVCNRETSYKPESVLMEKPFLNFLQHKNT